MLKRCKSLKDVVRLEGLWESQSWVEPPPSGGCQTIGLHPGATWFLSLSL
jgi:hypothetical protein